MYGVIGLILLLVGLGTLRGCMVDTTKRILIEEQKATYFLPYSEGDLPLSVIEQRGSFRSMQIQYGPRGDLTFHFHVSTSIPVPLDYIFDGNVNRVYHQVPGRPDYPPQQNIGVPTYIGFRITPGSLDPSGRPITNAVLHWWTDENHDATGAEKALR